jgi:uncharacterized protein involved in oxidation of intracellular sulfur
VRALRLTVIVNDAPYGSEKTWNALRLAGASASAEVGMDVRVFLMGDAVTAAKRGQATPEGYYNLERMLSELAAKGVEGRACGACMKSRGMSDAELVEGVRRGTMMILAGWVKDSDRVVTF